MGADPRQQSIWTRDLFGFPGPGSWLRSWRAIPAANLAVRRDAKALLYGELAAAMRAGMPLDEALASSSQTVRESWRAPLAGVARGADRRDLWWMRIMLGFWFLFIMAVPLLSAVLYIIIAAGTSDSERVARLLALRLRAHVRKGQLLSIAMRRLGADFSPEEIAIVDAGERWNRLPEALDNLGAFQAADRRLSVIRAGLYYPAALGALLVAGMTFIFVVIIPKFKDIFDQLGAELPSLTQQMIDISNSSGIGGWLSVLLSITIFGILVRVIMNGTYLARFAAIPAAVGLLSWLISIAMTISGSSGNMAMPTAAPLVVLAAPIAMFAVFGEGIDDDIKSGTGAIVILCLVTLFILILPVLVSWLERLVNWAERLLIRAGSAIPLFGRLIGPATRVEMESRWLAGLSLALENGEPAPEALRTAGRLSHGWLRARSEQAARFAEAGRPLGESIAAARVLEPRMSGQLALTDSLPDPRAALRAIADDAATHAIEVSVRAGRTAGIVGTVMMASFAGMFILSMYLPLFNIPKIVGR